MKMTRRTLVALQAVAASLFCHGAMAEDVLNVPDEYPTILDAVVSASNGDTVLIQAGTYTPGQAVDLLGKAITLKGVVGEDGLPATIIDGAGANRVMQCMNAEDSGTVIENLVLSNGLADGSLPNEGGAGLYCEDAAPTVRNCMFLSNEANALGGGALVTGGSPVFEDCRFEGNSALYGAGIYLNDGSEALMINCVFESNHVILEGGGLFAYDAPVSLDGCRISGNTGQIAGGFRSVIQSIDLQNTIVCGNVGGQQFGPWNDNGGNCVGEDCDADSDEDGTGDCLDGCPDDPDKVEPGECGCGVADTDTDSDGTPDCVDGCPEDAEKTEPGECGCGVADTDSDSDGTPDCSDGCPEDAEKTEPGECGCGVSDTDSDSDGTPDCLDGCPEDAEKIEPGECGCGVAETDSDSDGTPDCVDGCPEDAEKTEPGECGCGVADSDSDSDGTPDCVDGCPEDAEKTEPGECGCGVSDTDSDSDGTPDCSDGCPEDVEKTEPGECGCGVSDIDSDSDGTPDCNDGCPDDSEKTDPGLCGCGVPDGDADGDSIPDCNDPCPTWVGDCSEDGQTFIVAVGQSIQTAMDTVPDGGTVQVMPGTYTGGIDFLGRSITLESTSGLTETVLDGSGLLTSVVRIENAEGDDSSPVIRGFTIRNGSIGSVYPLNNALRVGGGVFAFHASPTIEDCVFENNSAGFGGGIYTYRGSPVIRNCVFDDNFSAADGGGLQMSRSVAGLIENSSFQLNSSVGNGGAIHLFAGSLIIRGSLIDDNQTAGNGAGINWVPATTADDLIIDDCTITNNMAGVLGGGVRVRDGFDKNLGLSDTTVCDNDPDEISGEYVDLGGNTICACPGDFNNDGEVGGADLGLMLAYWDACPKGMCPPDLNGDNNVDGADIGLLLGYWGFCN